MFRLELKPLYEGRKSYYGKAYITLTKSNINKVISLYSYDTHICDICKCYIHFVKDPKLYTKTTIRHIRELTKQYAGNNIIGPISKEIIIKNNYKLPNIYNCYCFATSLYNNRDQCKKVNYEKKA